MEKIELDEQLVITQYYAFRSTTQVAKLYGCSSQTILRLLYRNGVEPTRWKVSNKDREKCRKYAPLDEKEKKRIVFEYKRSGQIRTAAELTHHSQGTVSKVVHEASILDAERTCRFCGKKFKPRQQSQIWCSRSCRNSGNPGDDKKRCRRYGVYFDPNVKRDAVLKRDNYICQICGIKCDPNDRGWGSYGATYPTLDHIIPLANGGTHTWDNVQCACGLCNSRKSNRV